MSEAKTKETFITCLASVNVSTQPELAISQPHQKIDHIYPGFVSLFVIQRVFNKQDGKLSHLTQDCTLKGGSWIEMILELQIKNQILKGVLNQKFKIAFHAKSYLWLIDLMLKFVIPLRFQ